jgi:hypothetical protein
MRGFSESSISPLIIASASSRMFRGAKQFRIEKNALGNGIRLPSKRDYRSFWVALRVSLT